jgi:hypothetical protein
MAAKIIHFIAILLTAIAVIPGGAHLFALPNKIRLDREAYFAAQAIYSGWARLGAFLIAALIMDAVLALGLHVDQPAFLLAVAALFLIIVNLGIFFLWTYPANKATANWTQIPENWEALRRQWEYSHAANAVITFVSLALITLAGLTARQ